MRVFHVEHIPMGATGLAEIEIRATPSGFGLTEEEVSRFLRIVAGSLEIKRHYQLFLWLNGEIQHFLPHQILVSAWGDFSRRILKLDVTSRLPGVRTEQIRRCQLQDVVESCYARWANANRRPLVLNFENMPKTNGCDCHVHEAIRRMRSVVIHGLRDDRGGHDSLYIAFEPWTHTRGGCKEKMVSTVDSLIAQIDFAFRKVAAYPLHSKLHAERIAGNWCDLSTRELEILDWVCRGNTNAEIAAGLGISQFTVKNHVQRIFKKLGASNRTQAVARYNRAFGEHREQLV